MNLSPLIGAFLQPKIKIMNKIARIFIYPSEIQQLEGISKDHAYKLIRKIKPKGKVLISEYSKFRNISEKEVTKTIFNEK